MKKKIFTLILGYTLAFGCVSCGVNKQDNDNGAYKPSVMYNNTLYSISPYKSDAFDIEKENLEYVGVIEDVISGTSLPTENMQASGNNDILGCNVYLTDQYPNHLFVFEDNGEYYVYISE